MEIAIIDGIVYQVLSIVGDKMKIVCDESFEHIKEIYNSKRVVPLVRGRMNELMRIVAIVELADIDGERILTIQIEKL